MMNLMGLENWEAHSRPFAVYTENKLLCSCRCKTKKSYCIIMVIIGTNATSNPFTALQTCILREVHGWSKDYNYFG
ncbi:hypothetical protein SOVF_134600 [Spinacia oleracea]|nr:hypothetical protein SOVF_134600 [Spinacia oleracea]